MIAGLVVIAMVLIGGAISNALREQHRTSERIAAAFENAFVLNQTLRLLVDAETGQRGYLLTKDLNYLQPYTAARRELPGQVAALAAAGLASRRGALQTLVTAKMAELDLTIRLARSGRRDEAMRVVLSGIGKQRLDAARAIIAAGVVQQRREVTVALQFANILSTRTYLLFSGLAVCAIALVVISMLLLFRNVRLEAETNRLREVEAAERQTRLLVRELNHRVKNLFSVVLAIVRLGVRHARSPAEAIGTIQSRVQALASAHEVSLGQELLLSADLGALLRATLSPFDSGSSSLELDGPPLMVCATCVTPLGLIMHELATNAVKYGAWRSTTGKVTVRWRLGDATVPIGAVNYRQDMQPLHLEWDEMCDTPLHAATSKDGFGSHLIETAMLQLNGHWTRERRAQGLRIDLNAPIVPAHPTSAATRGD